MLQFIMGFTTGIYVAQNYNIPKIIDVANYIKDKITEYEINKNGPP
ncbi:MAG: hypothetical protein CBC48_11850 [bacterium TMED88]|nr:MAG: hypothetical protein CBC48_11850 [bacterium TMED88]